MMKRLLEITWWRGVATLIGMVVAVVAHAQVDASLSQYWTVPAYYNAAATGRTDFIHISAGARLQWVGIKHAPMTFMALADMPFKLLNRRWGAGVRLQQESVGLYSSIQAGAQLSWKKKMLGGTLSIGVQPGIVSQTFKGSKVDIPEDDAHTKNDDAIPTTDVSGTAFDISAGVMFEHKWFWTAISSTHINAPSVTLKTEGDDEHLYEFNTGRAYYLMAGSNIPIKNTLFELQPSIMVGTDFKAYTATATMRVRYKKFLSAGVGYRHNDAVSIMVGADYKNFTFGYCYDYPISAISRVTHGSHELFVSYNVKLDMGEKNRNSHRSIRIM